MSIEREELDEHYDQGRFPDLRMPNGRGECAAEVSETIWLARVGQACSRHRTGPAARTRQALPVRCVPSCPWRPGGLSPRREFGLSALPIFGLG